MENKLQKVEELLKKNGQEELLNYNINYKEELLDEILQVNFEQMNKLYKKTKEKEEPENTKIEPIKYTEKAKLSEEEKKKYEQLGSQIIKNNKYAVVTMAGGQGTRLGHNGPKGTYDFGLPNHKSIFEVLCDNLKQAYQKFGVYVEWYIMTSQQNNEDTIGFFEKNNYFNYPKEKISFFKQGELPVLNTEGKLLLNKEGMLNEAADGHGGIFVSMRKNGVIKDMKQKGIEWAFLGPVDNVLAKMVDDIFVGMCEEKKVLAGGKSLVKAYPEEKVGVFCKKQGKPKVIEYTEIPKEMAEKRDEKGELEYGESHINCNLFNIKAIDEISKDKLPYHTAYKKIEYLNKDGQVVKPEKPNAYKFESFIFDAFEQLDDMVIFRVKREEEFAPIKNAEGKDSPETAKRLYEDYWKKQGGEEGSIQSM